MAKSDVSPTPPRLVEVNAGHTTLSDGESLTRNQEDIEGIELRGDFLDEFNWSVARRCDSSIFTGVTIPSWKAKNATLTNLQFADSQLVSLETVEATWWNVSFRQCRIGAGELYRSRVRNVHFSGCKIDYLNLRHATLIDVAFTDCIIGELDLMEASLKRCSFDGSTIARLDPLRSKLDHVDLRGARLGEVANIAGLRGSVITMPQVLDLAPTFALSLGIHVT